MTKKKKAAQKPRQQYVPVDENTSTYSLKGMDRKVWTAFTERCEKDGRRVKFVVMAMVKAYADGEFRLPS